MEQGAGRHTANISGNGMTKSTDSKSVTNGNGIVTLLDELSKKYGADLNQIALFDVLMMLEPRDRDRVEDEIFGGWGRKRD